VLFVSLFFVLVVMNPLFLGFAEKKAQAAGVGGEVITSTLSFSR
jgi:hypothetical protein